MMDIFLSCNPKFKLSELNEFILAYEVWYFIDEMWWVITSCSLSGNNVVTSDVIGSSLITIPVVFPSQSIQWLDLEIMAEEGVQMLGFLSSCLGL